MRNQSKDKGTKGTEEGPPLEGTPIPPPFYRISDLAKIEKYARDLGLELAEGIEGEAAALEAKARELRAQASKKKTEVLSLIVQARPTAPAMAGAWKVTREEGDGATTIEYDISRG